MTNKAFRLGLCIAALLGFGRLSARSDSNLDTWKAVTAAYARCDAAAAAHNVAGTLAIDMQEYKIADAAGKVLYSNGPKMVEQYRKTYAGATQVKQQTTVQKLTLKSGYAKATILQRLQLSSVDPNINGWRTWVIDWKMEDIWVSTGGVWKRKRTVMLNQSSSKRTGQVN